MTNPKRQACTGSVFERYLREKMHIEAALIDRIGNQGSSAAAGSHKRSVYV
jgi:hypothetical protein